MTPTEAAPLHLGQKVVVFHGWHALELDPGVEGTVTRLELMDDGSVIVTLKFPGLAQERQSWCCVLKSLSEHIVHLYKSEGEPDVVIDLKRFHDCEDLP